MKRFKEFINEGITDYLKPKSEEEIKKALKNLDIFDRIEEIEKRNLSKDFLPSKKDINNAINKMSDNNKKYVKICNELFNTVCKKYDDIKLPIQIKYINYGDYGIIFVILSKLGWGVYLKSSTDIDWIGRYTKNISSKYVVQIKYGNRRYLRDQWYFDQDFMKVIYSKQNKYWK